MLLWFHLVTEIVCCTGYQTCVCVCVWSWTVWRHSRHLVLNTAGMYTLFVRTDRKVSGSGFICVLRRFRGYTEGKAQNQVQNPPQFKTISCTNVVLLSLRECMQSSWCSLCPWCQWRVKSCVSHSAANRMPALIWRNHTLLLSSKLAAKASTGIKTCTTTLCKTPLHVFSNEILFNVLNQLSFDALKMHRQDSICWPSVCWSSRTPKHVN